jgi:hypothetical protein
VQLISSGALKAIAQMAAPNTDDALAIPATGAIAAFASEASDAASVAVLLEAQAIPLLLSRISDQETKTGGEADLPSNDDIVAIDAASTENAGPSADISDGPANTDTQTQADVAVDNAGDDDESSDGGSSDQVLAATLTALAAVAASKGDGVAALVAPMRETSVLEQFRSLLRRYSSPGECSASSAVVEATLQCLLSLGRSGAWIEIDNSLSEDLARFLALGTAIDSVAAFLITLLADRSRAARLGDIRPLRRAAALRCGTQVEPHAGRQAPKPQTAAAVFRRALENLKGCDHCGMAPEEALLICTRCRKVEYCSRECQKAAWKLHKQACVDKSAK